MLPLVVALVISLLLLLLLLLLSCSLPSVTSVICGGVLRPSVLFLLPQLVVVAQMARSRAQRVFSWKTCVGVCWRCVHRVFHGSVESRWFRDDVHCLPIKYTSLIEL